MTTVLVLGLLVGWFWWQQNGLSSDTITVSSAPDGFAGYRIAVVSDLHAKEFGEGNRVLLDYVRDLEPDLVAVVGDILHEPDQMSMIPAVAKGLAAIAPPITSPATTSGLPGWSGSWSRCWSSAG